MDDVDVEEGSVPSVDRTEQLKLNVALRRRGVAAFERHRVKRRVSAQRVDGQIWNRRRRRRQNEGPLSFAAAFVFHRHLVHACGQPCTGTVAAQHVTAAAVPVAHPCVADKILVVVGNHLHKRRVAWAHRLQGSFHRRQVERGLQDAENFFDHAAASRFSSHHERAAKRDGRLVGVPKV